MTLGSLLLNWRRNSNGITTEKSARSDELSDAIRNVRSSDLAGLDAPSASDLRYAALLNKEGSESLPDALAEACWKLMENDMAIVPAGHITLGGHDHGFQPHGQPLEPRSPVRVESYYLDRFTVRNSDFARFVAGGGYDEMQLWPEEIWPSVVQFVDQTGLPGPRFWSQGQPPRGKEDHPVVGVSWFEAHAYARWVGKRLPNSAEWEKAASWPADLSGRGPKSRYPWGNAFDPSRTNTWTSGLANTVRVDQYPTGCTPNGIYQLVGNVWEWIADRFLGPDVPEGLRVFLDQPMGEIRGAAFDTYFEVQATSQFRSGLPLLSRRANLGFRCALSADAIRSRAGI